MSFLGKEIRLKRLFHESGRYLGVAVDQATARGIFEELMPIERKISEIVAGGPDGITMHKGIAEKCFAEHAGKTSLVLKASTFSPWQPNYDTQTAYVDEAVRLGADAISMGCIVGGDDQPEQLRNLGQIAREASAHGLPLIAHIYPRGNQIPESEKNDWKHVAYAVRAGAELGVDVVKTKYTGDIESFQKVVASTPGKVVVAGGNITGGVENYFKAVRDVLDAGGAGITFGRFAWNTSNPTAVVKALSYIIHEDGDVKEALDVYNELMHVKQNV